MAVESGGSELLAFGFATGPSQKMCRHGTAHQRPVPQHVGPPSRLVSDEANANLSLHYLSVWPSRNPAHPLY